MIYIIVEGITDKALVNNILANEEENINYKFLGLKGDGSVKKEIKALNDKDLSENVYFAIVDADMSFKTRNIEITKIKEDKDIDFFIFPNHKDDGDLETLLLSCIDDENEIIKCFDKYKKCVKKDIDNKAKLYAYTDIEHNKKPEEYIEILNIDNNFKILKQKLQNLFKEGN